MATPSQISANQKNAQHSSGPKTEEGKAISALNNFRHGFTGAFVVLPWEDPEEYIGFLLHLREEHKPSTITEHMLVDKMAQHYWLSQRAGTLQNLTFNMELPACEQEKQLALYLRYQTTHDRGFHKCLDQLVKLRAEKRKARLDEAALSKRAEDSRIGFESQRLKSAEQERRDSVEKRKQELHKLDLLLAEAKLDQELFKNWTAKRAANLDVSRESELLRAEKAA